MENEQIKDVKIVKTGLELITLAKLLFYLLRGIKQARQPIY